MLVPGATGPAGSASLRDCRHASPPGSVYRGDRVPDIIGDNSGIVAEGKLDAHGTFTANTVLAKCPSKLENAPPEEHDYGAGAA